MGEMLNIRRLLSLKWCGIPIYSLSILLQRQAMDGGPLTERPAMREPELYRAKAAENAELAKMAKSADDAREFKRREGSYTALANNEQWLSDHYDQTVNAIDAGGAKETAPNLIGNPVRAVEQ